MKDKLLFVSMMIVLLCGCVNTTYNDTDNIKENVLSNLQVETDVVDKIKKIKLNHNQVTIETALNNFSGCNFYTANWRQVDEGVLFTCEDPKFYNAISKVKLIREFVNAVSVDNKKLGTGKFNEIQMINFCIKFGVPSDNEKPSILSVYRKIIWSDGTIKYLPSDINTTLTDIYNNKYDIK